jgi:ABC-type transporter Mla maintaining outer membrane lipid asymmetry ATPase subunit MlaF
MTAVIDTLTVDLTKKLGLSAVVVTHDMTSAFRIATQMILLFEGRSSPRARRRRSRTIPNPSCSNSSTATPTGRFRSNFPRMTISNA